MATWYTDNINGNDTTGDGTIALPYKTIAKAVTVAANDDTIRVAGSGYTSVAGTLTFGLNSATVTTSRDMTADLPSGTVFTVTDPDWGGRTCFYKVRSITSTTITLASNAWENGTAVGGIEKVTTNTYYTTATGVNLDDLNGLNKTGIKLEGGWNAGFTAQDGVTWFVQNSATALSGTALRNTVGNMVGLSINKFGFSGVTGLSGIVNGSGAPAIYGDVYTATGTFQFNNNSAAHANGCNLYINTSAGFSTIANTNSASIAPIVINNFYNNGFRLISGTSSTSMMFAKINNLWTKAQSTGTTITVYLQRCFLEILNWYPTFTGSNAAPQIVTLTSFGNIILKNIEKLGNIAGPGARAINLKQYPDANVQIIAPTENVDTWGLQTAVGLTADWGLTTFAPILDIEGEKQYYGSGSIVFADPTVYETGTNSYRVNRSVFTDGTDTPAIPVKSLYISDGTAKTISIRYKSASSFNVKWQLLNNGEFNPSLYPGIFTQTTAVTANWTTVTYTIAADTAARLIGTYIQFCIVADVAWSSPYVWIDSVTIA